MAIEICGKPHNTSQQSCITRRSTHKYHHSMRAFPPWHCINWLVISRRHFWMLYDERKYLHFDSCFTEYCNKPSLIHAIIWFRPGTSFYPKCDEYDDSISCHNELMTSSTSISPFEIIYDIDIPQQLFEKSHCYKNYNFPCAAMIYEISCIDTFVWNRITTKYYFHLTSISSKMFRWVTNQTTRDQYCWQH